MIKILNKNRPYIKFIGSFECYPILMLQLISLGAEPEGLMCHRAMNRIENLHCLSFANRLEVFPRKSSHTDSFKRSCLRKPGRTISGGSTRPAMEDWAWRLAAEDEGRSGWVPSRSWSCAPLKRWGWLIQWRIQWRRRCMTLSSVASLLEYLQQRLTSVQTLHKTRCRV